MIGRKRFNFSPGRMKQGWFLTQSGESGSSGSRCAAHELSGGMAQAGGHCASTRSSALTGFAG